MKKIFYGWWIVLAAFLINIYVAGSIFFGFTAFFEPIVKEFGWSYTQVSLAISLRGLEMGFLAPLVGFLVGRIGSRKLIFWGMITIGLGLLLLSLTKSLPMFYASFLLVAFGSGGCTAVVLMNVVATWFNRNVGKALGIMTSGVGLSGLMIPFIVWLIDFFTWRTALVILGMGMFVIGIPLSMFIRNQPEDLGDVPDGRPTSDRESSIEVEEYKNTLTLREAFRSKAFRYLAFSEMLRMMAATAVLTHIMPSLSAAGIPRTTAGFIASAIPVLSIVGRFGVGWLADILDKRYAMAVGLFFLSAGLLTFYFMGWNWTIYLFLILFSLGFGSTVVVRGAMLSQYFSREQFGKLLGLVMGAGACGGIIGPTLAGWVFDRLGMYGPVWLLFFAFTAFTIFLILRIEPADQYRIRKTP
ncbi:MAG: MFS transporter [Deltaproteobacteria bacterium]|nr:MFS transporter [Deltaproteobacteria bacterium]